MGGSSWKVAYADFMTAMMAFFLVMWLLNMAPASTLEQLAQQFSTDGKKSSNTISPYGMSNNTMIQYAGALDTRHSISEAEKSDYAIAQSLKEELSLKDASPTASSGISSDGIGVLLNITPDLMFEPNTVKFTGDGMKVMDAVLSVVHKYKVYIVVRGHADKSETGAPYYPSKWELSSARANAAVRFLVEKGVNPSLIRSIAYADTRPRVPSTIPNSVSLNGRVEFYFHRPEVMSTIVGY